MSQGKLAEFVELSAPGLKARLICSYAQRAYEGGLTLALHVPDEREARELDEALWTFAQDAFIPHVRLEEARDPLIEPVVLFSGEPGELESDVLVLSVDGELPDWFGRFPHIRDFAVLYDEALRQAGRRRYAACKAAGYRMSMVKPAT
jgi:DNA polymerase-3 subunit chi